MSRLNSALTEATQELAKKTQATASLQQQLNAANSSSANRIKLLEQQLASKDNAIESLRKQVTSLERNPKTTEDYGTQTEYVEPSVLTQDFPISKDETLLLTLTSPINADSARSSKTISLSGESAGTSFSIIDHEECVDSHIS